MLQNNKGYFRMVEIKKFYDEAYSQRAKEDVVKLYDNWAKTYDLELDSYHYVAPQIGAELFASHLKKNGILLADAKILDVGCGTGLVGHFLHEMGFVHVDGLDLSTEMLAQAKKRGIYAQLHQVDMTLPGQIPDESYDAVISVGMFTHNHVGPNGLVKVLSVMKSGGIASITVNADAYIDDGYRAKFDALVNAGACKILEEKQEDYIIDHEVHSRIVVLQKT